MQKVKKSWIALLSGALLMVTLVGLAGARPMRQTTYKLTIPAAHFHPRRDGLDWYNHGDYITLQSLQGVFYAALPIALPGRFTVEKLTLFAYDHNDEGGICAHLYRVNPWTQSQDLMETVCTADMATTMQVQSSTDINPDTIYGGHGGYVMISIPSPSNLDLYAVQIEYH